MRINDIMDEVELDDKMMMVDGKPKSVKEIIDDILKKSKKDEKSRKFAEG